MACQLSVLAHFGDLRAVKRYLFPEARIENVKRDEYDGGWDDADWGWKDESGDELEAEKPVAQAWLQDCQLSLSPAGDLMAVARDSRLVLLQQKWNPRDDSAQCSYATVYEGIISQEPGESITCVFCLPLASQKKSNQGGPDWTCTIVGFNSGYIRIYTENGTLLLSQIFSEERIVRIKCHTYTPPRHIADGETLEELSILYSHSLVTIDGFSFFQSLKACKNQVARATASGNESFQPPPLAYKKWALHNQDMVTDYSPFGLITPNVFDQMKVDSLSIGANARAKLNPPASHLYITAGMGPYTGYYYTVQGGTQPLLSDVAHAVANKLKSAFLSAASGWLGLGGAGGGANRGGGRADPNTEKRKPKIEPATALPARFGLYDKRRSGESIVPSPDGLTAATTDSFGRVILVDIQRGIAVKMWKGYRDAQVGWVEAREDALQDAVETPGTGVPRRASFLVIYAPRRGILEVWTTQHGPRVAAFSISKSCRLISTSYGVLGLNNVTFPDCKIPAAKVYLFDSDGAIKIIDVPFHLALSDKNSKRARDVHILKQLKISLREHSTESQSLKTEVINALQDMKTFSIVRQGIERTLSTTYLSADFLASVVSAVRQQMDSQQSEAKDNDADVAVDFESRSLHQYCRFNESLIRIYSDFNQLQSKPSAAVSTERNLDIEKLNKSLCEAGISSPDDVQELTSIVCRYRDIVSAAGVSAAAAATVADGVKKVESSVAAMSDVVTVVEFIGYFECQTVRTECEKDQKAAESQGELSFIASVQASLSETKKTRLAKFIFETQLALPQKVKSEKQCEAENSELTEETQSQNHSKKFVELLEETRITAEDLMGLMLHLWLSEERKAFGCIYSLQALVKDISKLYKKRAKEVVEGSQSSQKELKLWVSFREACSTSNNISSALMMALVGRSIACRKKEKKRKKRTPVSSETVNEGGEGPSSDVMRSGGNDDNEDDDELIGWESITLDRESWDLLVRQLEDLLVLQCLLKMRPQGFSITMKAGITWEPEPIVVNLKRVLDGGKGVIPEFVGKWMSGNGIPPCMLCQREDDVQAAAAAAAQVSAKLKNSKLSRLAQMRTRSMSISCNPLIAQLQEIQWRMPHTLDSDVLLSNCAWEFMVIWNRDPEAIYPLEQAIAYLKCVQNAILQHGIATMMWQMFLVKRLSSAALLIEKVGKCPKDRLCRKEVGFSDVSLGKFMAHCVNLLDIIVQATADSHELPLFDVEDGWQAVQGPTPLVELAVEQREANVELVQHHLSLCLVLQSVLHFHMKSVKPMTLFGRKGMSAFFKPLHSLPLLADKVVEDSIANSRKQFLRRLISDAVLSLISDTTSSDKTLSLSSSPSVAPGSPTVRFLSSSPSLSSSPQHQSSFLPAGVSAAALRAYSCWPAAAMRLAANSLNIDVDLLRQHHSAELYRHGLDKLAEEVLLTVSDRETLGSELLRIGGMRLAQNVFSSNTESRVEKLSQCSPRVSTWLKSLDPADLSGTTPPLSATSMLLTNVVNMLSEGEPEYDLAIELIDLAQGLS